MSAKLTDHWHALGNAVIYAGPHVAWIVAAYFALYAMGIADLPAWSKDIVKLTTSIQKVEQSIKRAATELTVMKIRSAETKVHLNAQDRQLRDINTKLDLVLNRLLTRP